MAANSHLWENECEIVDIKAKEYRYIIITIDNMLINSATKRMFYKEFSYQ